MKKRFRPALLAMMALVLLLSGCSARSADVQESAAKDADFGMAPQAEAEAPRFTPAPGMRNGLGASGVAVGDVADRMIIRQVSMSVVVEDTDVMLDQLQQVVVQYGGYVSDLNRWLSGEQPYASVTLRIPAENLEQALGIVRESAISIESETSTGDDVTEEFVDVSARLRNLEATETELLELLTEVRRNRGTAEDILAIHNRITQLRSEIESLKGRQQYLERSTALATVRIEIRPRQRPGAIVEPTRWNPLITASDALRAFVSLIQLALDVLIWVLILSPFVLVPILVIWLIIRTIRRRRRP